MSSEPIVAGMHKDPVTGEMISKTFVLISLKTVVCASLIDVDAIGSSSAAKSNAKEMLRRQRKLEMLHHRRHHLLPRQPSPLTRMISTQM
jgi:hypothetical protein